MMAATSDAGLPHVDVLKEMLGEFTKTNHPLTPLVAELIRRMSGAPRAGAPARRSIGSELTGLVPGSEAMLVLAGDQSGRIAEGFRNAAEFMVVRSQIKNSIVSSLIYPTVLIGALLGVLIFFAVSVLPSFEKSRPRAMWPSYARALGTTADNVAFIVIGTVALLSFIAFLIMYVAPRWVGNTRHWFDRYIFPFPLISAVMGSMMLTQFAGYISAGVPTSDAVTNIRDGSSPYMASHCNSLLLMMRSGKGFEACLTQVSLVHSRYHWLIRVYALLPSAPAVYKTISSEMTNRVLSLIKVTFGVVLANILLLLVAVAILWIVASMFGIANPGGRKVADFGTLLVFPA